MYIHSYAYGHRLKFFSKNSKKSLHTLYIDKTNNISLTNFQTSIYFDTNQNRTIYLKLIDNFQTKESFTKWIFIVKGVVSFVCDTTKQQIYYQKDYDYTDERRDYWLIHILLPIYFTLSKKYYLLHTGSVNINNKAVLFSGNSHAGKSTLTDYFLKKKHHLVSDDKLATFKKDEAFYCVPSHPHHRPYRGVEDLGIKTDSFTENQLEIDRIYWLKPVKAEADIQIDELIGIKKFEALRFSTEIDFFTDNVRFEYITNLANRVKMYEIQIPHNLDRLEEVYTTIITHIKMQEI